MKISLPIYPACLVVVAFLMLELQVQGQRKFVHPGILHTKEAFEVMREKVAKMP